MQLLVQRTGETTPYPAALTVDGNRAFWVITAADTAIPGQFGKAELRYMIGDVLAKSETWTTLVLDALGEPSETPPEAYQGWVDQVLEAGAAALTYAAQAKADADKAAQIAAEMGEIAAQVGQDAATASQAKADAQTAQSKAETAQRAAETARKAAEDAAGTASSDAAATAEAATRAETAASQAAAALADLQALYLVMQEYVAQAAKSASNAKASETLSKSYAVGGTGTREGEDTDNSKYWAGESADSAAASKEAQNRAETAAVRQPYPNPETGTWWKWDAVAGAYVDTGVSAKGADGDSGLPDVVSVAGAEVALILANNTEYRMSDPVTSLEITGFAAGPVGKAELWSIIFTAGETITVTVPDTVVWAVAEPVFTAGSTYWITVTPLNGRYLAVWMELEATDEPTSV